MGEESVPSLAVQFTKDVVDQKERAGACLLGEDASLRQLQGERDGALLSLGGKLRRGHLLQLQTEVVPMRSDCR